MDEKKREDIAVFRYGVIAAVLHGGAERQSEYFTRLAQTRLEVPHLGPRLYSVPTFKSWLRAYRRHGLEGLKPKSRSDCGRPRAVPQALSEAIRAILAKHPRMGVPRLRQRLIEQGMIRRRSPSASTLRRHIAQAGLRPPKPAPKGRKPFEKPHANDMWTIDFMHGPRLPAGGRRTRKTYLLAAIDDHSRFITAAGFYARESAGVLSRALQQAFLRHGLPKALYCDNGSAFSSARLTRACAQLGVALIHSKPYDSPSRGKIERWFGTVRRCFLAAAGGFESLEDLNRRFLRWLEQEYHRKVHSGTGERPLDRYMRSLARSRRPAPSRQELEWVFFRELTRRVRNDCTVSVGGRLWEAPSRLIGQKVSIRHPEGEPECLHLFEEGMPVCRLHPVRLAENANQPPALRFSLQPEEEEGGS